MSEDKTKSLGICPNREGKRTQGGPGHAEQSAQARGKQT